MSLNVKLLNFLVFLRVNIKEENPTRSEIMVECPNKTRDGASSDVYCQLMSDKKYKELFLSHQSSRFI